MELDVLSSLQGLTYLGIETLTAAGLRGSGRYSLRGLSSLLKLEIIHFLGEQESFSEVHNVISHPKLRRLIIDSVSLTPLSIVGTTTCPSHIPELQSHPLPLSASTLFVMIWPA